MVEATAKSGLRAHLARQSIAVHAADVFRRVGVSDARVEDLLEAASISRGTFYKYYRNKSEVLLELYDLALTDLGEAMTRGGLEEASARGALEVGIERYFEYHLSDARLLGVLVREALRSESPLAARRESFRETLLAALKAAAREAGVRFDRSLGIALLGAIEALSLELVKSEPNRREVNSAIAAVKRLLAAVLAS